MYKQTDTFQIQRDNMVSYQIERRGIRDSRVLSALREVPRHLFVPEIYQDSAYEDGPLPIGSNQTISQPYIVALMTHLLQLQGDENVLEVGTGSGYQAAILAKLAKTVHTIEIHAELTKKATAIFAALDLDNIYVHVGDGSLGWEPASPYHAIVVTAAAPSVPQPLLQQLSDRGRLVIPVGPPRGQILEVWQREGESFHQRENIPVSFVPLRGRYGWTVEAWER